MDLQSLSIEEIWEQVSVKGNEQPALIENMNNTYCFIITDVDNGAYYLNFSEGKLEIGTEELDSIDCTLEIKSKYFRSLLDGKLNSTTAFMMGRLKVKGNIGLALKLEQLFKKINK